MALPPPFLSVLKDQGTLRVGRMLHGADSRFLLIPASSFAPGRPPLPCGWSSRAIYTPGLHVRFSCDSTSHVRGTLYAPVRDARCVGPCASCAMLRSAAPCALRAQSWCSAQSARARAGGDVTCAPCGGMSVLQSTDSAGHMWETVRGRSSGVPLGSCCYGGGVNGDSRSSTRSGLFCDASVPRHCIWPT